MLPNWSADCTGRSPHGERGLKCHDGELMRRVYTSLSSRRAWIEIFDCAVVSVGSWRRSPHGERGLKYLLGLTTIMDDVALLTESVD